jgi:hypothetical protein
MLPALVHCVTSVLIPVASFFGSMVTPFDRGQYALALIVLIGLGLDGKVLTLVIMFSLLLMGEVSSVRATVVHGLAVEWD